MAYVREKKVPNRHGWPYYYYQVVEGRWEDGKVRQKVIKHLGKFKNKKEAVKAAKAAGLVPK